ncbi:hypothetical protein PVAG01_08101 [Phlyctema vagabunda]|uniref:Myb-like domain-containing protein n=1 Tax=Phlyctema vagabunda TaxID=108571 RepID=A0ABR4P8H9_9HELO
MAQPQPLLPRAAHSLLDESFQIPQPSPGTDYSDYAPLSVMSTDPILPNTYRLASTQDNLADTQWWTPPVQSNLNQYQLLDNTTLCDGLPRLNYATDRTGSSSSDDVSIPWAIRPPVPGHVSPDQTLLNGDYLYVPSSSLESSQGACHSANNSNSGDPRCSDQSQAVFASVTEPHHDKEIHRHPLPYSGAGDSMNVPTLRSSGTSKTRSGRSRSVECKSAKSSMTKSSHQTSWLPNVPRQKSTALQRIEPKLNENTENYSVADKKQSARALLRRGAKDEFLVKSKMAGMSYKEIRRQGKFTEAESTLRGRYRTLTKEKNARVRKPEWNDNDVKLLERATRKLVQNPGTPRARMPWKLVAEYIASHGGSYHFGNSTCRKKWDEIQGHSDS